jgi:hypothetical protein
VVVVSNGSIDGTAAVARRSAEGIGASIIVLELEEPSKAAAIRAGEEVSGFPRLYLDADVTCPLATARVLLRAVSSEQIQLAVPTRRLDLAHAGRLSRLYYRTWSELPWVRAQLAGRGAVAVSEAGWASIGVLPDLLADDRFMTTKVPRDRCRIVSDEVVIRPPGRLRDVVRVRERIYRGNSAPEVPGHDASAADRLSGFLALATAPRAWPGLATFSLVTIAAKVLASLPSSGQQRWSRDGQRGGSR